MIPEAEYPVAELAKYNVAGLGTLSENGDPSSQHSTQHRKIVKIKKTVKKIQTSNTSSTLFRRHITERSWTLTNWYRHIHWKNFTLVVLVPIIGISICMVYNVKLLKQTLYFCILLHILTILAVNVLYHRYLAHNAFNIDNEKVVFVLASLAAGAGITSAKNWCSSHRAHHRYCDISDRDPHNIRRGFLFSHCGWMILIHNPKVAKAIKESKLDQLSNENIFTWQAENYLVLFGIFGLALPSLVCGWFWNDYLGGLVYAGFLKVFLVQHSIFAINSFGHALGTRPYSDTKSPRNNIILNLLTLGEGNLNFHHEFPADYRNGNDWYDFDPTRWVIRLMYMLRFVKQLKKTSSSTVEMSFVQQQQKLIDNKRSQLNWGIPIEKLPVFSPDEFRRLADKSTDKYLVVMFGIIHDITPFAKDHPGGLPLIKAAHGKDATTAFNGAVYQHSTAARNLLATMRIGVLGGSETLFWKQQRIENKSVPIDNDTDGNRIVRSGAQETMNKAYGGTADAA
ncbi:hypothetical protein OGAPHI_000146 [Ogataea philodendri]|uniref:Acyl-CoA desaturase n=1 Tax=Ogataea philodendri TaxID=1378263 RepID=A0A9P8TB31_9ASCO|nr:uncharacterized protein OGAPHI_000146 [Ogataea philodendri]KAH3671960.1 hypothetical protein OGAPHI_000146 [Ogataea philodendri]